MFPRVFIPEERYGLLQILWKTIHENTLKAGSTQLAVHSHDAVRRTFNKYYLNLLKLPFANNTANWGLLTAC